MGTTEDAALRMMEIAYTGEFSPARHSTFFEASYNLTPLLKADIFTIINPLDYSYLIGPSLQYSVATNWEIYMLAFLSDGDELTEFGGYPNQYFLRVMFSF